MENKRPYRYCIVPLCTNTTITAPEKYYFHVPNDSEVRKKWCHLMKRKEPLSAKTSRHCCEDHFNIESDTENLVKWRLCGGTLKLKQGTVPTKFECQKRNRTATVTRSGYEKRQRIDFIKTLLTKEVHPSVAQQDIEFVSCDNPTIDVDNESANPLLIDNTIALPTEKKKTKNKGIQVEQQKKDIQTQTIWTYLCKPEQHDDDDDRFEKKLFNYQSLLLQQYGFDPVIPETINQLKELRKVLCASTPKVDDSSQYINPDDILLPQYVETADGSRWQNIEDAEDIDGIIDGESKDKKSLSVVKNVRISEVPRIKVIAEKFSRFKKNNIEVRRLDEKVVCIEYDVYEGDATTPVQNLRAYFSIRPGNYTSQNNTISNLPSKVKREFNIAEEDLKKLNDKEIEIIDGKVAENKPYIEDLKKVLKRKQAINIKKNKSSLDLKALYAMAKNDRQAIDENFSDTNLLSKAELENVKDLIINKCTSSVYGINRKTVRPEKDTTDSKNYKNDNVVSYSIFVELLRN